MRLIWGCGHKSTIPKMGPLFVFCLQIAPEAKIVNNMASFRVEEVGPTASTEANAMLLAPEEVFRRVKAAPMAKEERTQTDKKRERRKKKKRQKCVRLSDKPR